MDDNEDGTSGNVTRGYNYVKPNWQDLLIGLFREALDALDTYERDPNPIAVKITKLYHALQYNRVRSGAWQNRWVKLHEAQPQVTFALRSEELGLLVELAMADGMVWPKPESWDASATDVLSRP